MAESWFVTPRTTRLELPGGQWIEVKQRLTYGEQRAAQAAIIKDTRENGSPVLNHEMVEAAMVMAYLVDWSLTTDAGEQVRIDTDGKKKAALFALDPDKFQVIAAAIQAHATAMDALRVAEKNGQAGETVS